MAVDFQTGDILLFSNKKFWFSRIVEWFTSSKYSHVGMVFKDPKFTEPTLEGLYLFESGTESTPDAENGRIKFGVQVQPLKEIIADYDGEVYYRKLTCDRDEVFYDNMAKIHSAVHNLPYDTDPIDMIRALNGQLDCNHLSEVQRETKYWCSALMAYAFVKLGYLPGSTPWTLILPKQFASNCADRLKFINCQLGDEILIHTDSD